jgi:hypothetical protein
VACGSKGATSFPASDDAEGGTTVAAGDASDGATYDPGATGQDPGTIGVFTSSDASPVVFDCEPGTYSGPFATMVTSDAGGLAALISFNLMGSLSITLQGKVTNTGAGEIPEPTLTIAPGAKLAGKDMTFGGNFNADLIGQLDCPSKTLSVTIANGTYDYLGDAASVEMQGSMSATYDGTTATPTLSMGEMSVSSSQVTSLGANGTWSATLQ